MNFDIVNVTAKYSLCWYLGTQSHDEQHNSFKKRKEHPLQLLLLNWNVYIEIAVRIRVTYFTSILTLVCSTGHDRLAILESRFRLRLYKGN